MSELSFVLARAGGEDIGAVQVEREPAMPSPSAHALRGLAPAQVARLVKAALPEGMTLAKDARVALEKAAAVAVLYLGFMAATERDGSSAKRKTLLPADVVKGLEAAGWAHLVPLLTTASSAPKRSRE